MIKSKAKALIACLLVLLLVFASGMANASSINPGGYTLTLNPNYAGPLVGEEYNITTKKLPTLSRADYVFSGWATSSTGRPVYCGEETITLTSNLTLYAVWVPDSAYSPINGIPAANGGDVYVGGKRWNIIGISDQQWLLISAETLGGTWDWETAKGSCDTVYNDFSQPEQNAVASTTKTDDKAYDIYAAANLESAHLFLLSASEAITYLGGNAGRQPGDWWLRSLYIGSNNYAGVVDEAGSLLYYVGTEDFGARPAFNLNLSSVLFSSAAEGGKSSAAAGGGEFGTISAPSGNAKLTLIDSSRSAVTANVAGASSAIVASGSSLAVSYSGVASGDNISALLCDSSGAILFYASLTPDGTGVWNMTIPAGLTEGIYTLKLFSEQLNGDKKTDYASVPTPITLTVSNTPVTTYAVTYKVVNGTWSDNTTTDKTETVASGASPASVPTGMIASSGYMGGTWDTNPADATITGDTTFTYSFESVPTYTLTIENGTGSGSYAEGASVTVTANTPETGKQFKEWTATGITLTDAQKTIAGFTFTMPANAVTLTATYEDIPAPEIVAAPTFSPTGGTFDAAQSVTLSCATEGAIIHYTTDGSTPTAGSTVYSEPISISTTTTIKAIAVKDGWTNSEVAEATYTIGILPEAYDVTVNNGTGSDRYEVGASVDITADDAPSGQWFKEWTGVDGLTFIEGSAVTASAALIMPAHDVEVTATYEDISPAIYTVTYKVVNGTWADETTTDKTENVTSGNKPASVPTGMIASSGYTGGTWDTDPSTATITGDTTFIYTFEAAPVTIYAVTYKIVNGTWADGTTTDKTGTVASGSSPASVPTGMIASSGYTGGAWDNEPDEATITGDTTFTYTFEAVPVTTHTVTYKVVNGTWADGTTTDKTETVASGSSPASVPAGMIAYSGCTGGAWNTDPGTVTIAGDTAFTYTFEAKNAPNVTPPTPIYGLHFTGENQTLVMPGNVTGGEMQYALGTDTVNAPTSGWSTGIPTGREAKTYYVWYRPVGDENHTDTDPRCVTVTISGISYSVVSGGGQEWRRRSNEPLSFTVKRSLEDELTFGRFDHGEVDGAALTSAQADTEQGSLILRLKPTYLETLSLGSHTVRFIFSDGTAEATFTVKAVAGSFEDVAVPSDTFTFKKVWQGDSENSIDFTLYKINGSVYHHGFDKKIVNKTEWRYNAWFSAPAACYVIEEPVEGYITCYENVGVYAGITDRCCDGGTIINKKIPKTGDSAPLALWVGMILLGTAGIGAALIMGKRRKASK